MMLNFRLALTRLHCTRFHLNNLSAIFDLRQRQLMQTFTAHDSDVKCIAVDESEEFFVTGSIDGDIKVGNVCLFVIQLRLSSKSHFVFLQRFRPDK